MYLASTPAANELLVDNPLALLIGMVLDQQIPLEKAFDGPTVLAQRIGRDLDARDLLDRDLDLLFRERPALHRFPAAMAKRVSELCLVIVERYDGDAAAIWRDATSGEDLYRRVAALPGFGEQKARIFVALLGKQLDVRPHGWRQAAGDFGPDGTFMSVADIADPASLAKVRAYKQQRKAAAKSAP